VRGVFGSADVAYAGGAREHMAKKEYVMAAQSWEVNVLIRPANGGAWYSLAVAQAAAGNKRRALEAIEKAASNGFRDAARIEREPLLAPLRNEKRYRTAIEAMGKS
jgi:tetratricopeptide (TPR) repeat protein